ncbi:hypothetical protein [Flavobacterium muglaense]|uniref:Transcription elongation factor n=1 Tax=Flavobacterium muglaense TaxID=2764716 RepID=A0A923N0T4_9FLAO|nr:hypothetical protein [Flavobacterium muglaense]MBC5838805.1 hypothetical protein [Flavobacterium muglaense]MBC5845311.1 hypothetical protein [Flavobacterium muglaense]
MKNKIDKNWILESCLANQNELIANFQKRESEINDAAFKKNASASQSEDRSAGKYELLKAIGDELAFAQKELAFLSDLDVTTESTVVEPGAVVVTDKLTFFIAISSDKIEKDQSTIVGISTRAPIYASMRGLEKGNSFQFNETTYVIEDLY